MRLVIQRVSKAKVEIGGVVSGQIGRGMLILIGIEHEDSTEDADWLVQKVAGMRIFSDEEGKMNLSYADVAGEFLVVSQFTLFASTKKGNRPSYIRSARPEQAIPLYTYFVDQLGVTTQTIVQTGEFGADMQVELVNDGPVTILVDSKNRE